MADDSYLRKEGEGDKYIDNVVPEKLEDVTARWWAALSERPNSHRTVLVIHFTDWIRRKMPQRPKLVLKSSAGRRAGRRNSSQSPRQSPPTPTLESTAARCSRTSLQ
jgi:hypothetical protein